MSTKPPTDPEDGSYKEEKTSDLSENQLAVLRDTEKQQAYEEQHRLQLQRRLCPGCGEADDIPF